MSNLLGAGYLEEWHYNTTFSGVPQGGIVSPTLSNLVLDRLDKFIEETLIPAYTRGQRRKANPSYVALIAAASDAHKAGDWHTARQLKQQAQKLPSRDPNDPDYRRLRYVRYADDFLLGFAGPKAEAREIKRRLVTFLKDALKLELNQEKTFITHARDGAAKFLGYEIHTFHADDKYDHRNQRGVNGSIGLRVPAGTIHAQCTKYTRRGKPIHQTQRVNDSAYSIGAQHQAEYQGIVQYYRLAHNLHCLNRLRWVMEVSLTKTLAKKFKTSRKQIYRRFQTLHKNEYGTYRVLEITMNRETDKAPLVVRFGGVPLRRNKWASINDSKTKSVWSGRTEVVERLLAQKCELCGAKDDIEVHHIHKLVDLKRQGRTAKPRWMQVMAARRRKTLIVC
jgi:hypothetical protein